MENTDRLLAKNENPYDASAVGCYIDGARGIYATDAIVTFVRDHGATLIDPCDEGDHAECSFDSEFAGCEFNGEIEDDADLFMNEKYPVGDHFWGRSEQGDWGLWPIEEV